MISKNEILEQATQTNLHPHVVEKDYVLGWLLAGINQHPELKLAWGFKGGTCLKKCYFETYRFSEDLDFTLRDPSHIDENFLRTAFADIGEWIYDNSGIEMPADRMLFEIHRNSRGSESAQGRIYYRGPVTPAGKLATLYSTLSSFRQRLLTSGPKSIASNAAQRQDSRAMRKRSEERAE